MHNRGIRGNRSSNDIICVGKVDDNNLVLFPDFFTHAYEMVRLKRQGLEAPLDLILYQLHKAANLKSYGRWLNAKRGQL